ncbi:CopG family transcriptional regulator [Deltaproteobacteria bacterium PRO3]|nr:CopG family transcriptional regulator [Deltaproteobacteria bacterium PRO3]
MIRTQISLSELEYDRAKEEAKKQGISLAEFFRRSLRNMLPASREKPWMRYAGLVESGNPKSSQQIDQLIYGQKD